MVLCVNLMIKTFIERFGVSILVSTLVVFVFPEEAYALSIFSPPRSYVVKGWIDLFLWITVVSSVILVASRFMVSKIKKTGLGRQSTVFKSALKILLIIGTLLLVFRLSLQLDFIRNWVDSPSQTYQTPPTTLKGIELEFKDAETLEPNPSVGNMPWIFAATDNSLARLRFDKVNLTYQIDKETAVDLRGRIEAEQSGIYVKDGNKLVRYSLDLERVNEWEPSSEIGVRSSRIFPSFYFDYVFDRDKLFVLAGNYLIILDKSLSPISSLPLEVRKGYVKGAHNIIVYKNTAYLLDNEVRPIYVVKIDVRDPKKPKIIASVEVEDKTPNLELWNQWLDIEKGKWMIYGNYGYRGGSGTSVYSVSIDVIGEKSITSMGYGLKVLSTGRNTPTWGLIDNDGQTCLTKLGEISQNRLIVDNCYQYPGVTGIFGENERYLLLKTKTDKREGLVLVDKISDKGLTVAAELKNLEADSADVVEAR